MEGTGKVKKNEEKELLNQCGIDVIEDFRICDSEKASTCCVVHGNELGGVNGTGYQKRER